MSGRGASLGGMPVRFMAVGLLCALMHNAIVLGADWFGIHYVVGCIVSYVVVVVVGFALHVHFTFQESRTLAAFWRYAIGMAANYPLTLALLFLMCDVATLQVAIAAPLATVLLFAWNFAASRWAIVRTHRPEPTRPT
jgi:putative flippase GtrA